MNIDTKTVAIGIAVLALLAGGVWLFFFRGSAGPTQTTTSGVSFGSGNNISTAGTTGVGDATNTQQPLNQTGSQKIFAVAAGPVAGATLVQTLHPTTTVARYVAADNGHIFDLVLDSSGSVPRAISNTTIPGVVRSVWLEGGEGVVLQYVDSGVFKSVHLALPSAAATSSTPAPIHIQFLPDNALSLAASPDGDRVAYLLNTASGVDGYTADADGTGSKKLFSLPLHEVELSWPAPNTLLVQTKSALGVPGMVFSVRVSSGAVVPLLYASGLTALADRTFSYLMYQINGGGENGRSSYVRNVDDGTDVVLSFDPYPEKCLWSSADDQVFYCATPLQYTAPNYLDLWHLGYTAAPDSILSFSMPSGASSIVAIPGSGNGGVAGVIGSLAVSPDNHYLLYVTRGDQSLWGVRLEP